MPPKLRTRWLPRYGFALLTVLAGLLLREGLIRLTGGSLPTYICLYPAVMISALFGGLGPGLLATGAAALGADYFILPPIGSLAVATLSDAVSLAFFSGMGVFMSAVAESYRRARQKAAAQDTEAFLRKGREIPARRSVQRLMLNVAMVVSLAILAASGLQSALSLRSVAAADEWEMHSHIVIQQFERLLSAVTDAETGQRGYLLTGEEKYLAPYNLALGLIQTNLMQLKQLTSDNASQQRRLAGLEPLILQKTAELNRTIELRRTQGLPAALAFVATDTGKNLMDQVRQRIAEGQSEENQLLQQRVAAKNADAGKTLQDLMAGGVLGLLMLITVFFFLKQENARRTEAEAEVRHHRDHLQEIVAARTEALSRTNEQLTGEIAGHQQAKEALRQQREWLRVTLTSIGDAVLATDTAGQITFLNPVAEVLTGWAENQALGQPVQNIFRIINEQTRAPGQDIVAEVLREGKTVALANHTALVTRDGREIPIEDSAAPIKDGGGAVIGVVLVFHDVTKRHRDQDALRASEATLLRLNRTLRALSRSSQAMFHATDESDYMQEVCRDIQECGHAMVWIGMAENDEAKSVRPVAHAGFEAGYLETLHVTWADDERGRGPTGTAIRTGAPAICQDMSSDASFGLWREEALKRGYASSLVLPLADAGKTFGAVTIYSRQPHAFPPDEVQLLGELAGDLAHGITALRLAVARNKAEAALHEREEQLRLFVQYAPAAMAMLDARMCYLAVSEQWLADYHLAGQQLLGRSHYEVFPEVPERWKEIHRRCLAGATAGAEEDLFERANGTKQWIRWQIRPWHVVSGAVGGLVIFTEDITARKQAERDSARLAAIVESSFDAIIGKDLEGIITSWNAGADKLFGYSADEMLGTPMLRLVPPERHAEELKTLQQIRRGETVSHFDTVRQARNGRLVAVSVATSPIKDAQGRVIGASNVARDITQRKRVEETLRLQFGAMRAAANGIVITHCDGTIEWVNDAFTRLTGYSNVEAIGQNPRVLKSGAHPPEFYGNIWQTVLGGHVWQGELINKRKDGTLYHEEMSITPVRGDQGVVTHFIAIKQDITARKQAETALAQAKAELERQNQELEQHVAARTASLQQALTEMEQFAYVASHDLQEPLRAVSSFSQLLARRYQGKLDADADEFITFIVEAAARMQALINDLLALSRIGTRGNPFAPVGGAEILHAVKENLGVAIAESGAVITHDPLPTLVADRTQMTQLFQNLFSNAIKFRRPQEAPRIHVSATREDGVWRLGVRDNGIGIDPRYFERIFIVFQRLHNRDEYPGTGIGLAISKKIVERHGGRLWVESEPGKGSTFLFTIPDAK